MGRPETENSEEVSVEDLKSWRKINTTRKTSKNASIKVTTLFK